MTEFIRIKTVRARKQHRCEQCGKPIEAGTEHVYVAQKYEGEFGAYREHPECRDACSKLNFELRDTDPYDGYMFLRDDEIEPDERDWLRERWPVLAERMGWNA